MAFIGRAVLSLRYKVIVRGEKELIKRSKDWKGILFLPNHTSHMDPLLFFLWFWPQFKMRPLIVEFISHFPVISSLIQMVRCVLVPDFETSINQYKLKKAEVAVQTIIKGIQQGDNFVIFPSGKFKNQSEEQLGGASSVHTVLQKAPHTHIVLVRFSGLWGSSFSKALVGKSPHLLDTLLQGAKLLIKNLIFFAPRRKIYIDFEANPKGFPREGSRVECNRFLENWYNHYSDDEGKIHTSEPLKLVRNYFWSKEVPAVLTPSPKKRQLSAKKSDEIAEKIYKEIRKILDQPQLKISPEMYLGGDLGMDSLNVAEMVAYLFKTYAVKEISFSNLQKVEDLILVASGCITPSNEPIQKGNFSWPEEKNRPIPNYLEGATIPEAFLNICKKMGPFSALGDDVSGVFSYKKCKKAALVLAEAFRKIPEECVAILLPSSVGSTIVLLALMLAGKVPVPLNWTLGPRYLEQMMTISGAKTVLSSWRFMEKINFVDFGSLSDQIDLLEDVKKRLTLKMKLKGVFLSLLSPAKILKKLQLNSLDENAPSVILFTSGSEAAPKGVPLSHKNILSTIYNCCWNLRGTYTSDDAMYGILPQFHSFGFTNSTFTPFLCGMRVAFYPNPADSLAIAEGIDRWKVTLIPIVPNFLKKLLNVAKKEQLKTLRFVLTAGEKTPPELFKKVEELHQGAFLLEGYGLSETSPVIAMMRVGKEPKGVGQLFPGIEAITIHPETHMLLLPGEQGEICVRGPNVFHGYIGKAASPFIEIKGKSWFRTGDLGYIDQDQTLMLTGRLKRFVKIGGEMISLGAIEEALNVECRKRKLIVQDIPSLAICPEEADTEHPKLILFSIFPIELELANEILRDAGFSNVIKVYKIQQVNDIPLMGSGKINYRALQSLSSVDK